MWITLAGAEPVRHARLEGKHLARWNGPPRRVHVRQASVGPPRYDPAFLEELGQVEMRPLGRYERLLEEVQP